MIWYDGLQNNTGNYRRQLFKSLVTSSSPRVLMISHGPGETAPTAWPIAEWSDCQHQSLWSLFAGKLSTESGDWLSPSRLACRASSLRECCISWQLVFREEEEHNTDTFAFSPLYFLGVADVLDLSLLQSNRTKSEKLNWLHGLSWSTKPDILFRTTDNILRAWADNPEQPWTIHGLKRWC